MIERYSNLLKNAMYSAGVGEVRLVEMLRERGIDNINKRRISEYINNSTTPPFHKARIIMDTLSFPIDDEMLTESLEYNRQLIREEKEMAESNGYTKSFTVKLKYRKMGRFSSSVEAQMVLNARLKTVFGENGTLTEYVEWLISEDLKNCNGKKEE